MGLGLPRAAALCAVASCTVLAGAPVQAREKPAAPARELRYCVVEKADGLITSRVCKTRTDWIRVGYDAVRGVRFNDRRD